MGNLEQAARNHLNKIVNEDKYHIVNRQYFEAFQQRADYAISKFSIDSETLLTSFQQDCENTKKEFNSKMDELEHRVEYLTRWTTVSSVLNLALIGAGLVYLTTTKQ